MDLQHFTNVLSPYTEKQTLLPGLFAQSHCGKDAVSVPALAVAFAIAGVGSVVAVFVRGAVAVAVPVAALAVVFPIIGASSTTKDVIPCEAAVGSLIRTVGFVLAPLLLGFFVVTVAVADVAVAAVHIAATLEVEVVDTAAQGFSPVVPFVLLTFLFGLALGGAVASPDDEFIATFDGFGADAPFLAPPACSNDSRSLRETFRPREPARTALSGGILSLGPFMLVPGRCITAKTLVEYDVIGGKWGY